MLESVRIPDGEGMPSSYNISIEPLNNHLQRKSKTRPKPGFG